MTVAVITNPSFYKYIFMKRPMMVLKLNLACLHITGILRTESVVQFSKESVGEAHTWEMNPY